MSHQLLVSRVSCLIIYTVYSVLFNEAFCLILILLQHKSSKIDEVGAIKVAGWNGSPLLFIYFLRWLLLRVREVFHLSIVKFFEVTPESSIYL